MVRAARLIALIWLATLYLPRMILPENIDGEELALFPTNVRVKMATTPGMLNLTWDCNITEEMLKHVYNVAISQEVHESLDTFTLQNCFLQIEHSNIVLHKAISLSISKEDANKIQKLERKIQYVPEGKNGTAANNVSCVAYNTSSMNCSWRVGSEAPDDIQYHLSLRQNNQTESCRLYKKDSLGRNVACSFRDLTIKFNLKTYFIVTGSSNKSQIQLFDQWSYPSQTERMNPPRNITVDPGLDSLKFKWEQPDANYHIARDCLEYEFSIQSKDNEVKNTVYKSTEYKFQGFNIHKDYTLQMRARESSQATGCHMNPDWGEWSKAIPFGNPPSINILHAGVFLSLGTVLIAVTTVFLCKKYQLRQQIFPPIPDPKNRFKYLVQQHDDELQEGCVEHGLLLGKGEAKEIILTFVEEKS